MTTWTAIVGASKYAAAVASGDIADEDAQRLRIARCRTCPSLRVHKILVMRAYAGFCGQPFADHSKDHPATCGCLVASAVPPPNTDEDETTTKLRVLAAMTPAGKACVASEVCPQGRW